MVSGYVESSMSKLSDEELFDLRITYNLKIEGDLTRSLLITGLFEELVEPKLVQPHIITEHPYQTTPLCKPSRNDKRFVERFQAFAAGFELCNAYSELNVPVLRGSSSRNRLPNKAGSQSPPDGRDFCEAIETEHASCWRHRFGIDRDGHVLLTNSHSIRDVSSSPL